MAWQDIEGVGTIEAVREKCKSIAAQNRLPEGAVEAYPMTDMPFKNYSTRFTSKVYRIVDIASPMNIKKDERLTGAIPHAYILWYGGKPMTESEFLDSFKPAEDVATAAPTPAPTPVTPTPLVENITETTV